jgi:hypothetical protein
MEGTWASRDLPVLDAVVSQVDELLPAGDVPEAIAWTGKASTQPEASQQ